jgi:oligopeptide transport system ATP-binding protein
MSQPLLKVDNLQVRFTVNRNRRWPWEAAQTLRAVDGVSFELYPGETLGVVGESGCGKSTLARAILGLLPAQGGQVSWMGEDLLSLDRRGWKSKRKELQIIFQDPLASLNPRMTIGEIIAEPLRALRPEARREDVRRKVRETMQLVGLLPNQINRYPHEFSGGQCQRIGIARALIVDPKLIVCDEPVSALDVSIQAQIVNLLKDLQRRLDLTLIFIAHDLSIVEHISDRVMVMYLGHVMEMAPKQKLYRTPRHPYTQALLSAVPIPDPELERNKTIQLLPGDLPSPIDPPSGCVFRSRCPQAIDACANEVPVLRAIDNDVQVACIRVEA